MKKYLTLLLIILSTFIINIDISNAQTSVAGIPWNITNSNVAQTGPNINDIALKAAAHINWGTTFGDPGYGFRDNAGTMQWKNSGGAWANIGSGGATPAGSDSEIQYRLNGTTFGALDKSSWTTPILSWIDNTFEEHFYKTGFGTADYERGVLKWRSNVFSIETAKGGTGVLRDLQLTPGSGIVQSQATIVPTNDITYNLGSTLFRWQDVFINNNVKISSLSPSLGVYTDINSILTTTVPSSGILGYWTRTGTTLSPSNSGDITSFTGDTLVTPTSTPLNAIAAMGIITVNTLPSLGEQITIDTQTYTYVTLRSGIGEITLGGTVVTNATNTKNAINIDQIATYSASSSGAVVTITTLLKGTSGNTKVFTTTSAHLTLDGSGFIGGYIAGTDGTIGYARELRQDNNEIYVAIANNAISDANWRSIPISSPLGTLNITKTFDTSVFASANSAQGLLVGVSISSSTPINSKLMYGAVINSGILSSDSNPWQGLIGTQVTAIHMGSGLVGNVYGIQVAAQDFSTASGMKVTNLVGIEVNGGNFATGTVNKMAGVEISDYLSGSTTNSYYGTLINSPTKLSSPTITNAYGLYIGNYSATASSISENIHSAGTSSLNFFEGSVGILPSGSTILGRLHLETIKVSSGTDNPKEYFKQADIITTDATQTTLQTITLLDNNVYLIEARIVWRCTGGTGGNAGSVGTSIIRGTFKRFGGIAIQVATTTVDKKSDIVAWDVVFTISTNDILISVTGQATDNITWHTTTEIQNVSS